MRNSDYIYIEILRYAQNDRGIIRMAGMTKKDNILTDHIYETFQDQFNFRLRHGIGNLHRLQHVATGQADSE